MYSLFPLVSVFLLVLCGVAIWGFRRHQTWWLPGINLEKLSSQFPFAEILNDDSTLKCHDNTLVKVLSIKGLDQAILSEDRIAQIETRRQAYFDTLAEAGTKGTIRLITLRDRHPVQLEGKFPSTMLEKINTRWMKEFSSGVYENRHFIILSVPPKKVRLKNMGSSEGALKKMVEITKEMLFDYQLEVVTNKDKLSKVLSFFSRLATFENQNIARTKKNINESVTGTTMEFDFSTGFIHVDKGFSNKKIQIISLTGFGEVCDSDVLCQILRIDGPLTVIHTLHGQSAISSLMPHKLPHQARQAKMMPFSGQDTYDEYVEVIDDVKNGKSKVYTYQLSIFCEGTSEDKCREIISAIKTIFHQHGISSKVATVASKHLYLSFFPPNNSFVYPVRILSNQLAHWTQYAFSGEAKGLSKCDWGHGPLRYFRTANKSVYSFQLHETQEIEALGHSIVLAPSFKGKTHLLLHLLGGASRHGVRGYIFDRGQGTYVYTQAVEGDYVSMDNKLNPFVCDNTPANITLVHELLLMMAELNDDDSKNIATEAVDIIFNMPKETRHLKNFIETAFPESRLKQNLKQWTTGPHAHWFNGINAKGEAYDALDVASNHLTAFDMTEVQKNETVSACVTFYIMERIRQEIKDERKSTFIFIDEAKPQLENEQFCSYVETMLLEYRKKYCCVVLAFQNAKSLTESKASSIIIEQCATLLLFENLKATEKDFEKLNLTKYEWDYVKGKLPISRTLKRSVLVKKENESVILDIDMSSGLGNLLKLYKSGSASVDLAKELKKKYKGVEWIEHYLAV